MTKTQRVYEMWYWESSGAVSELTKVCCITGTSMAAGQHLQVRAYTRTIQGFLTD